MYIYCALCVSVCICSMNYTLSSQLAGKPMKASYTNLGEECPPWASQDPLNPDSYCTMDSESLSYYCDI